MRLFALSCLAFTSLAMPAQAADWYEAETAHFIIKSEDDPEEVREFAEKVERFDRGLRFLQNLPEDHVVESRANKPVIYRFGDYKDMAKMAGSPGSGIGGFFISRAGKSVAFAPVEGDSIRDYRNQRTRGTTRDTDNPDTVLFHEYTHYFMFQNAPAAYPRWYSEGYAEMLSTMRFYDDGSFHIGDVPQDRAYQIKRMSQSRLTEMLDSDHKVNGIDYIQHYGTGWLLAHYLSFDPQREAKLRELLIAIGNGEDSLTAAQRIFGDLDDMQRELLRYKNGDLPGYDVRPNVLDEPEVTLRPLTDAEEAMLDEEMALYSVLTREKAPALAADLRSELQRYPDHAQGWAMLAQAEIEAQNYAAAAEAAAKAVEIDEDNLDGWNARAEAALAMAKDDPAYFQTARGYLAQTRRVDMEDPRPLIAYYRSFYDANPAEGLPEDALIALEQAYDTAGSDVEYRMMLGRQLVLEDRFTEANVVMRPVLFSGHSFEGEGRKEDDFTPKRLFDAVDGEDRDRAVALIDKALKQMSGDEDA